MGDAWSGTTTVWAAARSARAGASRSRPPPPPCWATSATLQPRKRLRTGTVPQGERNQAHNPGHRAEEPAGKQEKERYATRRRPRGRRGGGGGGGGGRPHGLLRPVLSLRSAQDSGRNPARPDAGPRGTATPEGCSGKARPHSWTRSCLHGTPPPKQVGMCRRSRFAQHRKQADCRGAPSRTPCTAPSRCRPRTGWAGAGCSPFPAAACRPGSSRRAAWWGGATRHRRPPAVSANMTGMPVPPPPCRYDSSCPLPLVQI